MKLRFARFIMLTWTAGLTQAYGIFQTFHTQNLGDPRAMLPDHHARQRANIALIGTLSGAGLGYLLGVCMTPALKSRRTIQWRLGELSNVSYLAASGATMLFLGYLGASFSSSVSDSSPRAIRIIMLTEEVGTSFLDTGNHCWGRRESSLLPDSYNLAGILQQEASPRDGFHHCRRVYPGRSRN